MNEYKIVKLSWIDGENAFAVMCRAPGCGWAYVTKCMTKADAEALLSALA